MITVSYKNTTPSGNHKQWVEYVTCEKTEQCPLYKENGKCACFRYLIGANQVCPNGKWNRLEGYTSRARKSADFANKARKDYVPTATEYKDKLCLVADYIYLPIPYLSGGRYEFKGVEDGRVVNKRFVKIEDFNEDFIEELVKFVPYAWFGGAITDYQNEHIPKFLQQLKEEMPVLYEIWAKKYPDTASKFKDVSPVGRTAYISTMPDGEICGWVKSGNTLTNDNFRDTFFFKGSFGSKKPLKVSVEITDDMVTEVTKSMVVDKNTKYVD